MSIEDMREEQNLISSGYYSPIPKSQVRVDIEYYKYERDVYPRGIGSWAFRLSNQYGRVEVWVMKNKKTGKAKVLPFTHNDIYARPIMFSKAKEKIIAYAAEKGYNKVKVLS